MHEKSLDAFRPAPYPFNMNHPFPIAIFWVAGAVLSVGCRGSGEQTDDATADTDRDVPFDSDDRIVNAACAETPSPASPIGLLKTVGDGTPTSCTAAALEAAVAAVGATDGGGTILFDCGGTHTIVLDRSLFIDTTLLVDGGGNITLSGGEAVRIFELDNYANLALQFITLADGTAEESGAAVYHPWYGTLRAIEVTFENNHCSSEAGEIGGGAVFAGGLSEALFSGCLFLNNSASNGGGILNRGSNLTIVDSTFVGNRAVSSADSGQFGNGGGLYIDGMVYADDGESGDFHMCGTLFRGNHANQHGSAVFSYFYEGTASYIDQCVFEDNEFDGSPTGGAGGLYHEGVPLLLTNSTFSGNSSDAHAAGLFVGSGSTAVIENCTFANNVVKEVGAAIFSGASPLTITHCTFSGNDADYAPAIFKGETAVVTLRNTLFANNTTPNEYSATSCHETFMDGGGNLQWPKTKKSGNADLPCTENIVFADPKLLPLADNGGPTPTMALSADSPARDAASDCPATDQRGEPRGTVCDIGAFEL